MDINIYIFIIEMEINMFDDNIEERYSLAIERISEINKDDELSDYGAGSYADYFKNVSAFILLMDKLKNDIAGKAFDNASLEELGEYNRALYKDVTGEAYNTSYANPRVSVRCFGEQCGRLFSMVYMEIRGLIVYMYERRLADATALIELFIELYCIVKDCAADNTEADYKHLKEAVYWYVSDYSDDHIEYRIRELIDPSLDFAVRIIMDSDLNDLRYLYRYGEYITDNEIKMAQHLNSLSEQQIKDMEIFY